jgi:signal transduction histidine kinase/ActR/RegA family two-component response regulator
VRPILLTVAFLAGVTVHAALYHLLLHVRSGEHVRRDRLFAITAFWLVLYDVACIGLYGSGSVAEGRDWQRFQLFTIACAGLSFIYYVAEFAPGRAFRRARRVAWVFPILGAVTLVERRGWLLTDEPKIMRFDFPFLGEVVYHESAPGPLQAVLAVSALYVPFFVLAVATRLRRQGERRRARFLAAGAGLFAFGIVNDGLVTLGIVEAPYLVEFSWTAVVVLMGYSLSEEVVEGARAKEELAEARIRLAHSERLESIGTLAGGVAHDLNNMLTPVIGYAQLVRGRLPVDSPERAHLGHLVEAAQRAGALTRKLLALGRKQVLEVKPIDVGENLRGIEPLLRHLFPENVALTIAVDDDLPRVDADAAQLEQVWMNLAANARDAMPTGGALTIDVQRLRARGRDGVDVYVSDTGGGMDPATLDQVFEPFFTTKPRGEGTGLGLAIVRGIVEQHGGRVDVARTSSEGTTFHLFLPASTHELPDTTRPALALEPARGHEQLLVVEDDEAVRTLVTEVLEAQGYAVASADSERALVQLLAARSAPIDLVVTDVILPDSDALKVVAHVASRYPGARFVYMTGHADEVLAPRGMLRESVALLRKPFTADELLASVRGALAKSAGDAGESDASGDAGESDASGDAGAAPRAP